MSNGVLSVPTTAVDDNPRRSPTGSDSLQDFEDTDSDTSEEQVRGDGLNLFVPHCPEWGLNEAFREVIQNTIDACVESAEGLQKTKTHLRHGGEGWYMTKIKSPKRFWDIGKVAYKAELVLTVSGAEWKKPKNLKDWHEDPLAFGYIQMKLVCTEDSCFDPKQLTHAGKQPENSHMEAVNRITKRFRMKHLQRIGIASKTNKQHQAGKFGEGFKVGALVAARNDFKVVVEARSQRRQFKITKKGELFCSTQNSSLSKEAQRCKNLIYVTLGLRTGKRADAHCFHPRCFRLLWPGVPYKEDGDILVDECCRGELYCMGIFVAERKSLLLGYDVSTKNFLSGRDRNGAAVHSHTLHSNLARLLEQSSERSSHVMDTIILRIREISDEAKLRRVDEIQAIFASKFLLKKVADRFRNLEGSEAFPCRENEKPNVENTFTNRKPIVLASSLVDMLRRGGYNDVQSEISFLLSDENQVVVLPDSDKLVKSAIYRLNIVNENFKILRDKMVFIEGGGLKEENDELFCREKEGRFYVNNRLLAVDESTPFLKASYKLGYYVARHVPGIKYFHFTYADLNDSSKSFYELELVGDANQRQQIRVNDRLLELSPKIRVSTIQGDETDFILTFDATEQKTALPDELDMGAKYEFQALTQGGEEIIDPLSQSPCCFKSHLLHDEMGILGTVSSGNNSDEKDSVGNGGFVSSGRGSGDEVEQWIEDNNRIASSGKVESSDDEEEEELEAVLSVNELRSIFCGDVDDWDEEVSSEEDESDSEQPHQKRARKGQPCDLVEAKFGTKTLKTGGTYYHRTTKQTVRVVEFLGKRLPAKKAKCDIILTLRNSIDGIFKESLPTNSVGNEDDELVYTQTTQGQKYLSELQDPDEDFDVVYTKVKYLLHQSPPEAKKMNFFAEFCLYDRPTAPDIKYPRELVLFAGIGGSSIGDKNSGFNVKWLVENDHLAAASLRGSHPKARIYNEDVREFLNKCDRREAGYPTKGQVQHIQSSPPCQGFSMANRFGGQNDESNKSLSREVVRATKLLRPLTGVMENVPGIVRPKHVSHLKEIMMGLSKLGYQFRIAVHVASEFGDPQNRQRVILTYARDDVPLPRMPEPTHHREGLPDAKTINEALADLVHIKTASESGLVQLLGGKYTFNHVHSPPGTEPIELDGARAANTVTTRNTMLHPTQNRALSLREYARLCSLPDDKQFFGSDRTIRKQIGNCVPVKLAEAIARPIIAMYNGELPRK